VICDNLPERSDVIVFLQNERLNDNDILDDEYDTKPEPMYPGIEETISMTNKEYRAAYPCCLSVQEMI